MAFGNPKKRKDSSRSITAAAERLADRLGRSNRQSIGESWQNESWQHYEDVPELRTAARLTAQAMGQCRLVVAKVDANGEPSPLEVEIVNDQGETVPGPDADHPAVRLLQKFAGGSGGQSALLEQLGVLFTVTGEGIMVGALDPQTAITDDFFRAQVYSPDQVKVSNKTISVRLDESQSSDRVVDEETDGVVAVRIWQPHPRYTWQADSAARSAMTPLREICLYDKHLAATAISRLVSAGLLLMPEGLTLPGMTSDNPDDADTDPFMIFLMHLMGIAIKERASAAARVPIMIRGDKEELDAVRLLMFDTPFDSQILALRRDAIGRFGTSVDMPGELLTGYGSLQHWTGALVTEDWVNNYLPAKMSLACGSLTTGWLYPALAAEQGNDFPADVIVWFDASGVRTRENTGEEAFQAYDRNAISLDTLRRVLGYSDADAPTPDELARQILLQFATKAPALAPLLLPYLGLQFTDAQLAEASKIAQTMTVEAPTTTTSISKDGDPPTSGGPGQEPDTSTGPVSAARSRR